MDSDELEAYFPFKESNEPRLLYHWDGDCHLVINAKLYHTPESNSPESPSSPKFEIDPEPYELMDDCVNYETQSVASTQVTDSTSAPEVVLEKRANMTLKDQLEFIMCSGKRAQKDFLKTKKYKRSRKTKEQLEILTKELENVREHGLDKLRVDELAEQTGLTEVQVYKWIWDHRLKE
eukprot:TRINITY_DN1941_c0_g1_i1.p1 TRINITY_DN1941_c0_g1~~TRINITY_DN1941_c0_g1_i1.p1  ORF type:complete len:178 (-),score=57.91 TRINITY_DN1941_c0_g1_i1:178-711(-)